MAIQHVFSNTVADGTDTTLVRPSDWNSNHNLSYVLSGNTAGASTVTGTDVVLYAGNNVTLSGNTANSRIEIVGAAGTGVSSFGTISGYEPRPLLGTNFQSINANAIYFSPIYPPAPVSVTGINIIASLSSATSSISHSAGHTLSYALYKRGTGTNSSRIELQDSSSIALNASYSSNLSGGYTVSQGGNSTTVSSAGTVFGSVLSGQKLWPLAFGTLIDPTAGVYSMAFAHSSATVGNSGAVRLGILCQTGLSNASHGAIATNGISISNATRTPPMAGAIFSVTTAAFPANVGLSQINTTASNLNPYYFLGA